MWLSEGLKPLPILQKENSLASTNCNEATLVQPNKHATAKSCTIKAKAIISQEERKPREKCPLKVIGKDAAVSLSLSVGDEATSSPEEEGGEPVNAEKMPHNGAVIRDLTSTTQSDAGIVNDRQPSNSTTKPLKKGTPRKVSTKSHSGRARPDIVAYTSASPTVQKQGSLSTITPSLSVAKVSFSETR